MFRPVAWGVAVLWGVGALVNDSGLVVAGMGACLAGPALCSVLLRLQAERPMPRRL
jgi:hypothetical protein